MNKWCDHAIELRFYGCARPMWEIQEVARTQSVQGITGNSPLSISSQILKFNSNCKLQKNIKLHILSQSAILGQLYLSFLSLAQIAKCLKFTILISTYFKKFNFFSSSPYNKLNHTIFVVFPQIIQREVTFKVKVWINCWICRLDGPITDSCRFSSRPPIKLTWLLWRTTSFQIQKYL